jgi:cytoskeletal protein CcmA (bactofilin family)
MFAKNSGPEMTDKEIETVIGASVKVEGNFVCEGNIIIEGDVKGHIETAGYLQVGSSSNIKADIKAGSAKIAGKINGNLIIKEHLELTETAQINGDITVGTLATAKGAILNGRCQTVNGSVAVNEQKPSE